MNFFSKVKIPTLPQTAREGWGTPWVLCAHSLRQLESGHLTRGLEWF